MEHYLSGTPVERFVAPASVSDIPVCRNNGYQLRNRAATSSGMIEYFLPGTGPVRSCDGGSVQQTTITPSVTQQENPSATPTQTPTPTAVSEPTPTEIVIPTIDPQVQIIP